MKFHCIVVAVSFGVCVMAGKYSREINEQKHSGGGGATVEFRIGKLNQVWEKAKRVCRENLRYSYLLSQCGLFFRLTYRWKVP